MPLPVPVADADDSIPIAGNSEAARVGDEATEATGTATTATAEVGDEGTNTAANNTATDTTVECLRIVGN